MIDRPPVNVGTQVGVGPCPTFYRACCYDASRGRTSDGCRVGYDHPGYHLTLHLVSLCPWEVDVGDWYAAIDELEQRVQADASERVIEWFCQWLPRCMALVPRRRRPTFLRGVLAAAAHHGWIDVA